MYMCVPGRVGGRERARERQKLHQPGQCHLSFKAFQLLFFPPIITAPSNPSFPHPSPPPSSWKIWKRKIKRLPPGSDARSPHASAARAGATPQSPLATSRLQRDGMQLLVIGAQVGKLCFFIDAFFFLLHFLVLSIFLIFFLVFLPLLFLVFYPPPLLRRTYDFICCCQRKAPAKKIMSKKRAYVLLPDRKNITKRGETFAERVHRGAGHLGMAARREKAKSLPLLSYSCDTYPGIVAGMV